MRRENKMRYLTRFMILVLFVVFLTISTRKSNAFENTRNEYVCAKTCTCAPQHLSDVPIMKWLTIPMNKKFNATTHRGNNVLDTENEDIILVENPQVFAAFCMQQDNSSSVVSEDFTPAVETLTLFYGPDSVNKTIENEMIGFDKLTALDIQGYEHKLATAREYSAVQLHHTALNDLRNLRYLNVQSVRIVSSLNATRMSSVYNHSNLTFLVSDDAELIPYAEYKKQRSALSIFSHLTDLHLLRLFHCHINTITREMFDGLRNLHILSLPNNAITELPEYAFTSTPLLHSLILSNNQIEFIRSKSFDGLVHLENLDLSGNRLRAISNATFAQLPKLNSLNLLDNPLENLSSNAFERTNMIRNLWIGSTRSFVVQEDAFATLSQLENLVLLGLNVPALHKGILRGLTNLKHFRVSGNLESLVFDTFTGSVLLEELIMRYSSLKTISVDAFYGLERLKRLDLAHNRLETLQPGVFDQLSSLKELNLAYNHFVTMPRMVLTNLQHVNTIRLEANAWNCSCDLTEWQSLKVGTKKITRTIRHPCNYQYDKIPCTTIQVEDYVHDTRLMPRCETPEEYHGWSVVRAVHVNKECADERAMFVKKHSKKSKRRRTLETPTVHEDDSGFAAVDNVDSNNEDNNLADLSPYLYPNDALYGYRTA